LDSFSPELEATLNEKDICVVISTQSGEIDLEYCVQDLRKVKISMIDYNFEIIGNIVNDNLNAIFTIPFEQSSEIIIRNTLGELILKEKYNTPSGENSVEIDLSNISSGNYFVEFRSGPFVVIKRIMILN
jgi:hypothetical protein